MFLDVHELALHKVRIRKTYAPGTIDLHSADFRQVEPLEVRATAELLDGQIRITGNLHTKLEMVCARCLDTVTEEISKRLRPLLPLHDFHRRRRRSATQSR